MQTDQRIEKEKPWPEATDRCPQSLLVDRGVEAEGGFGDDDEVEPLEVEPAVAADALEAGAYLRALILSEVDKGGARGLDREVVECRSTRGDAEGEIESEPTFQRLGVTAQDPSGSSSPEVLDEPAFLWLLDLEITSVRGGELLLWIRSIVHGQRTFRAETMCL